MARQFSRTSIATAAIFCTIAASSTLADGELEEIRVRSERVSYADLNLDNEEGRDALRWRLRTAAKRVCNDVVDAGSGKFQHNRDCREIAYRNALADAGLEQRTAQVSR